MFFFNLVKDLTDEQRIDKASRHYLDALNGRGVRHSVDCTLL